MARTVPTSATAAPGNFLTAALWNAQVRDLNNFALAVPVFAGYASTTQSIPGLNAMTPINLDTEVLDSDGGHSTVTNTSRYTATVPGTYMVFGSVAWSANTTGDRRIQIAKNGSGVAGSGGSFDPVNVVVSAQQTSAIVTLNGTTDYVEVNAAQASGGSLNTAASPLAFSSSMSVFWISR